MNLEYKVRAFVPTVKGCGARDEGWNEGKCELFQQFLNEESTDGWKLHSYEYRTLTAKGCGSSFGTRLICIFEKMK